MMKKTIELVKYQMTLFFRGSKFIMPLVIMAVFLYMMYSIKPTGIVDSFSISGYLVFFIMVWISLLVSSSEDVVMEQIQLLRVQKSVYYYFSKVIFLMAVGLIVELICLIFPIVQNILNHNELFLRQLTVYDLLNAFLLLGGCSFAGGSIGSLFHPRVLRDRKLAIVLTVLVTVLASIRTVLTQEVPILKAVLFIVPPLDRISVVYGQTDVFQLHQTMVIFLWLVFYGIVFSMVKSVICYRRKF